MASALEKRCIVGMLQNRYKRSRKRGKGEIIGELCERLGIGRKHAIRLLNGSRPGRPRNPLRRGRPGKYQDRAFKDALRKVWKIVRYPCGRILKSAIPEWLSAIEGEFGKFAPDVRERLFEVSPATIDRILRPFKKEYGRTFTRSGGFRDEIPIQGNIWNIGIPGYMEADTAGMCGGSMYGEFVNNLNMVDIASIWTETRSVFGRGSNATLDAVRDIEHHLPFSILGYDADNGGEVLNRHLYAYFHTERLAKGLPPVQVTRSRAYMKNDNAHIEQRNDTLIRKYLGYERMEFKEIVPMLNYYYARVVCPLVNHFMPSFNLRGAPDQRGKPERKKSHSAQEIADWSDTTESFNPIQIPEKKEWFEGACKELGLDPQHTSLFDMLEEDDRQSFQANQKAASCCSL